MRFFHAACAGVLLAVLLIAPFSASADQGLRLFYSGGLKGQIEACPG